MSKIARFLIGGAMAVVLSVGLFSVYAVPLVYAQGSNENRGSSSSTGIQDFPDLIAFAMNTINDIIILIIALGVVWVVYLAFMLIKAEGDKKEEARNSIIYGIVGIFVMVSVWGLVNIFVNTFGLNNDDVPTPPTLSV